MPIKTVLPQRVGVGRTNPLQVNRNVPRPYPNVHHRGGHPTSGRAVARPYVVLFAIVLLLLAGCASAGEPQAAVESYFEALVAGDETAARSLSCANYESFAATRVTQFENLDARLDGMACEADGELDNGTRVTCEGEIVITYDTDDQQLPLGSYLVVQEGGEWRMCGETE